MPTLLSLLLAGCLSFPQAAGEACHPQKAVDATAELVLSNMQPIGRIQIPAEIRSTPLPYLEVPVSVISNPERTPFAIFVSLEWRHQGTVQTIVLGNFTPYPADQTGSFMLRASKGFEKLREMGPNLDGDPIFLLLEMKRVHASKPWTSVRVTIAPVRWRRDL
jgi:hypothetical protein